MGLVSLAEALQALVGSVITLLSFFPPRPSLCARCSSPSHTRGSIIAFLVLFNLRISALRGVRFHRHA